MPARKYFPGQKIGRFIIQEYLGKSWYILKCFCGREFKDRTCHFKRRKSCGCASISGRSKIITREQVVLNQKFYRYRVKAEERGILFDLPRNVFEKLITGYCHYCGTAPLKTVQHRGFSFKLNGIDRKDNNVGYVVSNCVSCCYICNRAKSAMPYREFKMWLHQVASFCREIEDR